MNKGKYVFSKILQFFPAGSLMTLFQKYKGDYRMRMSCFTQCQHLLFGQFAGCKSLNEIELILKVHSNSLYRLGFDCTYMDFEVLYRWNKDDVYFVTRPKNPMRYETVEVNYNINDLVGIIGDEIIHLTGPKTSKLYPEDLRLVKYCDAEKDEVISFITNNFSLRSLVIANIYRNRWQIETFFKWIKGNLTIKALWGYSQNAVMTHFWVAISAYLMLAWIKAELKSPYSVTQVATIIEKTILTKESLRDMLAPEPLTENKNDKELNLVNN